MANIGDKFIITIGDKAENEQSGETLYRVKGFKSLVFDENGIEKLEKYEEKKGEWIPVTERLPEDDEDVLVTRVYTGSTHSFIDMVWFNKGKFLTQDGNLETSNVVAWMPLPKPYLRGEENG